MKYKISKHSYTMGKLPFFNNFRYWYFRFLLNFRRRRFHFRFRLFHFLFYLKENVIDSVKLIVIMLLKTKLLRMAATLQLGSNNFIVPDVNTFVLYQSNKPLIHSFHDLQLVNWTKHKV